MTCQLPPAEAQDARAIVRTHRRSIQKLGRAYYDDETIEAWRETCSEERTRSNTIENHHEKTFVAEEEGEVIGFGVLNLENCEVGAVYIDPEMARGGAGTKLLEQLEQEAIQEGLTRLSVVASMNAVDFYQGNGYQIRSDGTHELSNGTEMDCKYMYKELSK